MCSAIIKPSSLIIQSSESRLSLVIRTQRCSFTSGTKRGLREERGHPSTDDAGMTDTHLGGRLQGPRAVALLKQGGDTGDGRAGPPGDDRFKGRERRGSFFLRTN